MYVNDICSALILLPALASARSRTGCPGQTLDLVCPSGTEINIIKAMFGRFEVSIFQVDFRQLKGCLYLPKSVRNIFQRLLFVYSCSKIVILVRRLPKRQNGTCAKQEMFTSCRPYQTRYILCVNGLHAKRRNKKRLKLETAPNILSCSSGISII